MSEKDYRKEYQKLKHELEVKDRELLNAYKALSHLTPEKPKSNIDLKTLILQDLEKFVRDVNDYLREHSVNLKVNNLQGVLDALHQLRVLKPSQEYIGVTLDSEGYIKSVQPLHDFVVKQDVPIDILQGYYKILNGVIRLDPKRQALLWGNE